MTDILEILDQVEQMGIWTDKTPWTQDDYIESMELALKIQDLQLLLNYSDDHELFKKLTLEDLMRLSFTVAKQTIMVLSLMKRISLLEILSIRKDYLYNQCKFYDSSLPRDMQLSKENYFKIINTIKRLEILQNWLYGIE